MQYILEMSSFEFGTETFPYDSEEERDKGRARIEAKIEKMNDGVEREFREYEED